MKKDTFGLIYGLTNPYFKGLVKIGMTHSLNIEKRMKTLGTAVPAPFHCAFAYKVPNDSLSKTENMLHKVFAKHRIAGTEFFAVEASLVDGLLNTLGKFEPAKTMVQKSLDPVVKPKPAVNAVSVGKSPNMDFIKMGLHIGDMLVFTNDNTITCQVADNRHIIYKGVTMSLTKLTQQILQKKHAARPAPYWSADGVSLVTLYKNYVNNEILGVADNPINTLDNEK